MEAKREQEIEYVLDVCRLRWTMDRIPEDKVEEMSNELEQHLREAVRDGKPVEAVVGPDEFDFADSWAEEDRPPMSLRDRLAESAGRFSVLVTSMTVILHALRWTFFVPVGWPGVSVSLIFSAWSSRYYVIEPMRRSQDEPWWRGWSVSGIAALPVVGFAWDLARRPLFGSDAVLLHWRCTQPGPRQRSPWFGE